MTTRENMIAEIENGMGAEGNTETAERMLEIFEARGWIDYSERLGYFWVLGEDDDPIMPENGFIEVWNIATGANPDGSYNH